MTRMPKENQPLPPGMVFNTPAERLILMVREMRELPVEELHFRDYLNLLRLLSDLLFYLNELTGSKQQFKDVAPPRRVAQAMLERAQKVQLPVGPATRPENEPAVVNSPRRSQGGTKHHARDDRDS